MDHFNTSAGSASVPAAPAAPDNPYFTSGNPGLGVPATVPGPYWFHMISEEIRKVITDAGLTPDHEDLTQLSSGIQALIAQNLTSQASLKGGFSNLNASAPGTSPIVTYSADEIITGDGAGSYKSLRNWNSTIDMTLSGAGGLDTGAVAASTWYFVHAISKEDGTKAFMASLSSTTPTMPSGYTKSARVGAFRTDATANKYPLSFVQKGRRTQYKVATGSNVTGLPQLAAGSGTAAAVSVTSSVPSTASEIKLSIVMNTQGSYTAVAPNNNYVFNPGSSSSAHPPVSGSSDSSTGSVFGYANGDLVLESSNIYWWTAGANNALYCVGWIDNI